MKRAARVSDAFRSFVLDQRSGVFFGIIARDVLYLKVDDQNRGDYTRLRMKPFKPFPDRPSSMKYYQVPIHVLESTDDLVSWARKSVAAAERAAAT